MVSKDWNTELLGDVATLQRGFDLPYRLRKPGQFPIVTSSGIEDTHSEAKVNGPGVITGRYGTIGEVFYVNGEFWPLNTTLYVRDFHGHNPLFISYLLRTIDFHTHSGKSGVPGVNRNDLHEIVVRLPPTNSEEEAIAEALSDVDALIEALEQLVTKNRLLKLGAMQELLTGKKRLPGFAQSRGYMQTDVGVIPKDWNVCPLGRLVRSVEYGSSAKSSAKGKMPVLRMGNLQRGKIDWNDLVYTDDTFEIGRYALRPGDVLFNRTNTIDLVGKTSMYEGEQPAIFAGYLIRVNVTFELLDSRFLNYVLNTEFSRKHSARVLSVAVGQANINGQKLKTYPIPLPPTKAEQTAIASVLSDMDADLAGLEAKLAKVRLVKQGMMQELLTGRIRLV